MLGIFPKKIFQISHDHLFAYILSIKSCVQWKCLALTLSEEVKDDVILPHKNIKRELLKMGREICKMEICHELKQCSFRNYQVEQKRARV